MIKFKNHIGHTLSAVLGMDSIHSSALKQETKIQLEPRNPNSSPFSTVAKMNNLDNSEPLYTDVLKIKT